MKIVMRCISLYNESCAGAYTPILLLVKRQIQSNYCVKQRCNMEVPKGAVEDAVVVESGREWERPGRLHVFGVIGGVQSWHEVFDTISEMEEWLRSHPTYKVYSSWVSVL